MKSKKDQELYQKRQLEIAKSLYELGVDDNIIQAITKIEMDQVLRFRNEKQSEQNKQNTLNCIIISAHKKLLFRTTRWKESMTW